MAADARRRAAGDRHGGAMTTGMSVRRRARRTGIGKVRRLRAKGDFAAMMKTGVDVRFGRIAIAMTTGGRVRRAAADRLGAEMTEKVTAARRANGADATMTARRRAAAGFAGRTEMGADIRRRDNGGSATTIARRGSTAIATMTGVRVRRDGVTTTEAAARRAGTTETTARRGNGGSAMTVVSATTATHRRARRNTAEPASRPRTSKVGTGKTNRRRAERTRARRKSRAAGRNTTPALPKRTARKCRKSSPTAAWARGGKWKPGWTPAACR